MIFFRVIEFYIGSIYIFALKILQFDTRKCSIKGQIKDVFTPNLN